MNVIVILLVNHENYKTKYSHGSLIRIDSDAGLMNTDYFYELPIARTFTHKVKKDTKLRITYILFYKFKFIKQKFFFFKTKINNL